MTSCGTNHYYIDAVPRIKATYRMTGQQKPTAPLPYVQLLVQPMEQAMSEVWKEFPYWLGINLRFVRFRPLTNGRPWDEWLSSRSLSDMPKRALTFLMLCGKPSHRLEDWAAIKAVLLLLILPAEFPLRFHSGVFEVNYD